MWCIIFHFWTIYLYYFAYANVSEIYMFYKNRSIILKKSKDIAYTITFKFVMQHAYLILISDTLWGIIWPYMQQTCLISDTQGRIFWPCSMPTMHYTFRCGRCAIYWNFLSVRNTPKMNNLNVHNIKTGNYIKYH